MKAILLGVFSALACAGHTVPASAQLVAAQNHRVAMGHHHLMVDDVEANKDFWLSLGGKTAVLADYHVVKFPNVLIFLREQEPSDGSHGSVVNHIGLQFPDLRVVVTKLRANATPIITKEVVRDAYPVDSEGVAFNAAADANLAYALAPNGMRVELYENKQLEQPVANHHIHFYNQDVDAMKSWYVQKFGATPGQRSGMEAADVGGVNLTFSPADSKLAGTKGRAIDHIGFEVDGLETLCDSLSAQGIVFDRPYEHIDNLGVAVAFLTDPWGTYIELTEGLDKIE